MITNRWSWRQELTKTNILKFSQNLEQNIQEEIEEAYPYDWDENKNGQPEENFELSIPVAPRGFEPRQTEPKSVVLPLYYGAIPFLPPPGPPGQSSPAFKKECKNKG
jgi:hypothetical protein